MSAVQKMLGRTTLKKMSSSKSSNSYGVSDHVCMEEELPHPARNLTVSRVVIMVFFLTLSIAWCVWECVLGFVFCWSLRRIDFSRL